MAGLELTNVGKVYSGGVTAVEAADFRVADGEFIVLVGPSGCGKSTILRMIAGLETVTSGEISIGNRRVNELEPGERDIAMVFQNYALYPHMSVRDNMAYGLKNQRTPKDEIDKRIAEAAQTLQLGEYLDRKPRQLSGGQRQRVAMGRAIVREPQVFLFDEPLSNLDAKLRGHMRSELKDLHRRLDATFVFVTHDQVEAMSLADRIIIMSAGKIEQIGTPLELYHTPASRFVAEFIGSPPMNILDLSPEVSARLEEAHIPVPTGAVAVGMRPETLSLDADRAHFTGDVIMHEALGAETVLTVAMREPVLADPPRLVLRLSGDGGPAEGGRVSIALDPAKLSWFDAEGRAIGH